MQSIFAETPEMFKGKENQSFVNDIASEHPLLSEDFQDARSRSNSTDTTSPLYMDARSLSKMSQTIEPTWRNKAKDFAVYTFAFVLGSIFLFVAFAGTYHAFIYPTYDAAPFVTNYASVAPSPSSLSSSAPAGKLMAELSAQGYGTPNKPIIVTLFGDSLVSDADMRRHIRQRIVDKLAVKTNLVFWIFDHAGPGATIQFLMDPNRGIPHWIPEDQTNVAIVLSNSDVSNSNLAWSPAQWDAYKQNYVIALNNMTTFLTQKFGTHWAFGGPSVVTEGLGWFGPKRLYGFDQRLQDIRSININHAKSIKCTYMDFYAAVTSIVPKWWPIYSSFATQDGEHFSELGVEMEADNFVQFLLN